MTENEKVSTGKMDEKYHSYINRLFGKWALIYDLFTIPLFKIRKKVVDLVNVEKHSKILHFCPRKSFTIGRELLMKNAL